jgi:hypothetical protein
MYWLIAVSSPARRAFRVWTAIVPPLLEQGVRALFARQRDEAIGVIFLLHGEIDNRPYHWAEQHVFVYSYPLLSQAGLKSPDVVPSVLVDSFDFWISRACHRRGGPGRRERDHQRHVMSKAKFSDERKK